MEEVARRIWTGVISVLFPLYCVDCGAEGSWCCHDCLAHLPRTAALSCPVCAAPSPAGRTCGRCSERTSLNGLIAAASYADPGVRKIVKALKFDGAVAVLPIINRLSVHGRGVAAAVVSDAIVVPMPLHGKRERMRGYNQAEMFAKVLFPKYEFCRALSRLKNTRPQTELKDEARLKNINGAFGAARKFNGEAILLVDDVYTTGATMNEAARVLKEAGAGEIWGFVVARG